MKINSVPPSDIVKNYKLNSVQSAQKSEQKFVSDRVELSDEAKSFASVIQEVKNRLDIQSESEKKHAEDVSDKISKGTYSVDSSKVAEKIMGGSFDVTV